MYYYEVAPTKIIRAGTDTFTYSSETEQSIGDLVHIPVGKRTIPGIVTEQVKKPSFDTRLIGAPIEQAPLPIPVLETALWMADYYATSLATVLQTILPTGLGTTRRKRPDGPTRLTSRATEDQTLTVDQQNAMATIEAMSPGTALLHGVTGSGKTRVYIESARKVIANTQSVIILVPEIALTSQLVDEFSLHFPEVIVAHSRLTEADRHGIWRRCLLAETPLVVVGPRSALFLPLASVGLIVIDEMHEPSYKQEKAPRYSALRAASILASRHTAKLILGSATPPVSEYYLATKSQRPVITMNSPARTDAIQPRVSLVDMTKRAGFKKHRLFSDTLLSTLEKNFEAGEQALIFHNRRGSASTTLCENCGWSAHCPRCYVPFVLHADRHQLQCHICGRNERVPTSCPECQQTSIIHKGIGTKLIETELTKLFPHVAIARFDGDSENDVAAQYGALYDGSIQLIIGTQVIAKGLDLPHLRTVGVVQADAGLSLPDYASSERTFQLLAQVVGRVGRTSHETAVIVQSYQPEAAAVKLGLAQDYHTFYQTTLEERRQGIFPPFTFLLKLICSYKTEAAAIRNAQKLAGELRSKIPDSVAILGPTPAFYERQRDSYRWQLTLKSAKRSDLAAALQFVPNAHWQYELDPTTLL